MKPLSFIIIGSGWRSLFFARIAQQFPEQFTLKYMLCRTPEKAEKMATEYGIPTTISEEECDQARPDFVVVAVSKSSIFSEIKKWSDKGYPILSETPAGVTVQELKAVWQMVQSGAKIQVAEQYHRYPLMAAGLKAIAEGKLGEPHMVHLSLVHDYHATSLIRRMLQAQPDTTDAVVAHNKAVAVNKATAHNKATADGRSYALLKLQSITGTTYKHPVTETDSRYGAITDGSIKERERAVYALQFENGKVAYYDFSGVQYHSFIRSRHLNVKGQNGEWNDTMLRYVDDNHLPVMEEVKAYLHPKYACLETEILQKQSREWNPFIDMDNAQDEYAIATMMFDMREYIENGTEVYPIAEALEDAYLTLLMQQAAEQPGTMIVPEPMPWQKKN